MRAKAPRRPGKVPLEKGYSQMDWLRLCRTHPDLAGVRGSGLLLCMLLCFSTLFNHETVLSCALCLQACYSRSGAQ